MERLESVLREFDLTGEVIPLAGGSQQVYRVAETVLKQVQKNSLEHSESPRVIKWLNEFSDQIVQRDFRWPTLKKTVDGNCHTNEGWTAWTYLEGKHADSSNIIECINAINSYHKALAKIPKHNILETNTSPWGIADKAAWGDKPECVQPQLKFLLDKLYDLRLPLSGFTNQVIHGDLNPENILISPEYPPAIIDLSPFWGAPEFALAIYANFIGPRSGDLSVLKYFRRIRCFDQLLIRSGIRMLVVMSVINQLDDWESSSEKLAAELIVKHVKSCGSSHLQDIW